MHGTCVKSRVTSIEYQPVRLDSSRLVLLCAIFLPLLQYFLVVVNEAQIHESGITEHTIAISFKSWIISTRES